jgi:hypothetical protein
MFCPRKKRSSILKELSYKAKMGWAQIFKFFGSIRKVCLLLSMFVEVWQMFEEVSQCPLATAAKCFNYPLAMDLVGR